MKRSVNANAGTVQRNPEDDVKIHPAPAEPVLADRKERPADMPPVGTFLGLEPDVKVPDAAAPGPVVDEKKADAPAAPIAPGGRVPRPEQAVAIAGPSTDAAVVKRHTESRKKASDATKEHKNNQGFSYKSGFVKAMRKKMVDIVKDVQQKHGQMEQADNYINGDANVNTYFSQEHKRANNGEKSVSDTWNLNTEVNVHQRQLKLGTLASDVFMGAMKDRIVKAGKIDAGSLAAAEADSDANKNASKERLDKTSADKAIVEMYYNELARLHEENDQKNEGTSYFDSDADKRAVEDSKEQGRSKAEEIFKYGFIRQADVTVRHTDQKAVRSRLEDEGRITTTARRAAEATGVAILGVLVKTLTLGTLGVKKNRDKRGKVKGFDFTVDEATGQVRKKDLGGRVEFTSLRSEYRFARDELKAKWNKRTPLGVYAGASLYMEGFKKFIDVIQSIFSSAALFLTGAGLVPFLAPIMAPLVAFCSSVALAIGVAKASLSLLITLVNAIAQIQNTNPELFAEMSGETAKAGLNTLTDSAGIGAAAAWGALNVKGGGASIGDKLNFHAPAPQTSPGIGSQDWFAMRGNQVGAAVSSTLVPKVANAAVSATGDLDNNDMTYSQVVNEERRIGRKQHAAKTELIDKKEEKHIEQAAKTTKAKADAKLSEFRVGLVKLGAAPPQPDVAKAPEDRKENANEVVAMGNESKLNAENMVTVLDEVQDANADKK